MVIVPAFPKFLTLCCDDIVNELRKAKGTIERITSRAVFRSEIPEARLQKAARESRIGGTTSYGTSGGVVERLARRLKQMLVWGLLLVAAEPAFAQSLAASGSAPIKIVVLGDSLSAGHGLAGSDAFPAKLQRALEARGIAVAMTNAGVSGDTASGGRDRLDWSVPQGTEAVIVELGANDALRGTDPAVTRKALDDIVRQLKMRGIAVMLCGMIAPPNYGTEYAARFNAIYPDLAKAYAVPLYPFFLEGVAANPKLNQADGLHPTAEGVDIIVKNILPSIEAFLGSISRRAS
jgi:acyl-CoA thioesterase I